MVRTGTRHRTKRLPWSKTDGWKAADRYTIQQLNSVDAEYQGADELRANLTRSIETGRDMADGWSIYGADFWTGYANRLEVHRHRLDEGGVPCLRWSLDLRTDDWPK